MSIFKYLFLFISCEKFLSQLFLSTALISAFKYWLLFLLCEHYDINISITQQLKFYYLNNIKLDILIFFSFLNILLRLVKKYFSSRINISRHKDCLSMAQFSKIQFLINNIWWSIENFAKPFDQIILFLVQNLNFLNYFN